MTPHAFVAVASVFELKGSGWMASNNKILIWNINSCKLTKRNQNQPISYYRVKAFIYQIGITIIVWYFRNTFIASNHKLWAWQWSVGRFWYHHIELLFVLKCLKKWLSFVKSFSWRRQVIYRIGFTNKTPSLSTRSILNLHVLYFHIIHNSLFIFCHSLTQR